MLLTEPGGDEFELLFDNGVIGDFKELFVDELSEIGVLIELLVLFTIGSSMLKLFKFVTAFRFRIAEAFRPSFVFGV